jgi:hypothetical protein
MRKQKITQKVVVAITFAGFLGAMMLYGCKSSEAPAPATPSAASAEPAPAFALIGPPPQRSGVELWSDNCARCHNSRPPEEFSPAQWEAIVHHMRLRANLTGEEAREIVKFLQASSGT